MKVALAFACLCVAGVLGGVVPVRKNTVIGAYGKDATSALKSGDRLRDWRDNVDTEQQWQSGENKKSRGGRNWANRGESSGSDATASAQDWARDASGWNAQRDASSKNAANAAAASSAKDAAAQWSASDAADSDQAWGNNAGWRKSNRKHQGISYGFDKKFTRNSNDDGGYDAGSSLDDHSLDDWAERSASYDRVVGDHSARAAHADGQSADRSANFDNALWKNGESADKFGRDRNQANAANSNERAWAENLDWNQQRNAEQAAERSAALDNLNDLTAVDRNSNRKNVGYGAAGAAYGGAPYNGYGYGKEVGKNRGQADASSLHDSAKRQKNQKWAGDDWADRSSDSALKNQWQADNVDGFNRDQAASLHDVGYAKDAASSDAGARGNNRNWADADAARAAQQSRADLDEETHFRSNQKWDLSDRSNDKKEWKKFWNNDKKDGQNWERLKYNKDDTEDNAASDWAKKQDKASRWRDSDRFDSQTAAAKAAESARAHNNAAQFWEKDSRADSNGEENKEAAAQNAAAKGVWDSDFESRKSSLDQSRAEEKRAGQEASDRDAKRRGFDERALGGARRANFGGNVYNGYGYAGANGYPSYNKGYNYGFPAYNGYNNYANSYKAVPAYNGYAYGNKYW